MDSEEMEGFVNRLDEINALADKSDGFVWRLQEASGNATSILAYDDPNIIVNMSVWISIDYLRNFVYQSPHVELIRDRDAWFNKIVTSHMALWWVPADYIPTVDEGKEKLEILSKNGPSLDAFTFARSFEPNV
jgi:hypothetical protein